MLEYKLLGARHRHESNRSIAPRVMRAESGMNLKIDTGMGRWVCLTSA